MKIKSEKQYLEYLKEFEKLMDLFISEKPLDEKRYDELVDLIEEYENKKF